MIIATCAKELIKSFDFAIRSTVKSGFPRDPVRPDNPKNRTKYNKLTLLD